MANTGDDLLMDLSPPKPHDIVLHRNSVPTPPNHGYGNSDGKLQQTGDLHWVT